MTAREKPSWIVTANATNAAATATRAAPSSGLSHFITSVSGSFDGAVAGGQLILKEGATEIGRWYVHNEFHISFPSPVQLQATKAANLELAAGGAGVVGAATMTGYTL